MPKKQKSTHVPAEPQTHPVIARLNEWLMATEETVLLADGFEDALVGIAQVFTAYVAIYDREKCVEILVTRDGMDREEAEEYFEFNVQGASVGENTPGFLVWKADDRAH
jgi:hypothetical protein